MERSEPEAVIAQPTLDRMSVGNRIVVSCLWASSFDRGFKLTPFYLYSQTKLSV